LAIAVFEVVKKIKSKYIYKSLNLIASLVMLIVLISAFFTLRTGDTWAEGGVERDNPTTGAIFQFLGANAFILIGFIIVLYLVIKKSMFLIPIFTLGVIYFSSSFFMYFIASQMQSSKQINLWPRAAEVQYYSMPLIILIICIATIKILIEKYKIKQSLFEEKSKNTAFIGAVLFFFYSFFVNNLGSQMHGSMPIHSFNGAWFAHQGCSNPHEDPMLSKVFENFPEIQNFLRENCSSVNWPVIPPLN
jgi:glucan phosphoethanolaminetransferase (alkaline phosphatase superfamily)